MASSEHTVGQVVVITGASSGIGRDLALRYARTGAHLTLAARSRADLDDVAEQCWALGAGEVVVRPTDISAWPHVSDLFADVAQRHPRVDVVVQCAAITAYGTFTDLPPEVFDAVVSTNLLGAANVARAALTHFTTHEVGHLVMVGSLLGTTAVPYQSAYVASKFGLTGLVRSLQQEYRHLSGVRVHGIYPGPVDTAAYHRAARFSGLTPRTPPAAMPPHVISAAILAATMRRQSSTRQVGWMNWPVILTYRALPTLFDTVIRPFLHRVAFTTHP